MRADRPLIITLTLGIGAGGRDVVLADGRGAPVRGRVAGDALAAVAGVGSTLPGVAAGLLLPGGDSSRVRAEREVGQILAAVLGGDGAQAVRERLAWLHGRAAAEGSSVVLAVDARNAVARQAPWELLGALPPGESPLADVAVVRLVETGAPAAVRPAPRLRVLPWCPDPTDAACARVLGALDETLAGKGRIIEDDPGGAGRRHVLHLVCHGARQADTVALCLLDAGRREAAPDTAAVGLAGLLDRSWLVVLDVCSAGAGDLAPVDVPAMRFALGGAPAVIGPRHPLGVDASIAFSRALYGGLGRGADLATAVEDARRALRLLGMDHPTWRWWNPVVHVTDLAVLETPPVGSLILPEGWPRGEAGELFDCALQGAHQDGFLGLEHLVVALGRVRATPLLAAAQPALRGLAATLPSYPTAASLPLPTPRLERLAAGLAAPGEVDAVLRAVVGTWWIARSLPPGVVLHVLGGASQDDTLADATGGGVVLPPPCGPGLALEVLGGPLDGRQILLAAGQTVGRYHEGASNGLYEGGVAVDHRLSRRHLLYEGGGRVRLAAGGGSLERPPRGPVEVRGDLRLQRGDVLHLGNWTLLLVLGAG